ncbi:MAG: hypothetical protein Q9170_006312 [Blastenia crenularia]
MGYRANQATGGESRRTRHYRQDSGFASVSSSCTTSPSAHPTEHVLDTSPGGEGEQQAVAKPATWEEHLDEMKIRLLKDRRVTDPALLCCSYNDAAARLARRLLGKRKPGGADLCSHCLGAEFLDDHLPPFDNKEVNDEVNGEVDRDGDHQTVTALPSSP